MYRWKEEYTLLSEKWDKTVQSLRSEVNSKESRVAELTNLLREARDKTVDVSCFLYAIT